jgi:hypothetical protein
MRTATFTSNEGDTYMKLSAALRNSGDGWHVIDDSGHEPLGITIGNVTSTTLEVLFPQAVQVCDFVCGPDEGFAKPPYKATFGASVGLYRAIIQGTVSGAQFNPQTWANPSANIWVTGWMLLSPLEGS